VLLQAWQLDCRNQPDLRRAQEVGPDEIGHGKVAECLDKPVDAEENCEGLELVDEFTVGCRS
jgi:hypothetical protein